MDHTRPKHKVVQALTESYRALGAAHRRVLLAVSGGADSLALLLGTAEVSAELGMSIAVASLDHGLRAESKQEIESLRSLCERLGLGFHTGPLRLAPGPGVEERGRVARYQALGEIRKRLGFDLTATAHTANDQAETLLMRLARGAALRGASGILAKRGEVIRPLLRVLRSEVEDYVASQGQRPVRDQMNTDRAFFRSRVRHDLLPLFESVAGTGVVEKLASFAAAAAEDEELLNEIAKFTYERLSVADGALDAVGFRSAPRAIQSRLLVMLLETQALEPDRPLVERALDALRRSGKSTLPRGFTLQSSGDFIRCVPPVAARKARSAAGPASLS